MLKTRIKTAAVLVAIILPLLIFSDVPYVMNAFAATLSVMAVYELYHCIGLTGWDFWRCLSLATAALVPMAGIPCYGFILAFVFPLVVLCFLMAMLRLQEMPAPGRPMIFLLSMTVPLFFASIPVLRLQTYGLYYLMLFMLVCVATDAAAYFVGRAKGRHKLAPSVSPKKTIEGALGGTVTAILCAMFFCIIVELVTGVRVHYPAVVLYAASASVMGQLGDLSMSLIKRKVGLKDFGHLLPGHGGILDRFDSQLFTAPFTLLFVVNINPLFVR